MKSKTQWVVVADEAIARVMSLPTEAGDLEEVTTMTNPDAHATGAEFRRDAQGRRSGGDSRMGGNATASASDTQSHQEAAVFAQQVADWLADAERGNRYDELTVVAAPRFLGLLRKALSPQVTKTIVKEVDKDVIHESMADLTKRLFRAPMTRA
jgi:protein required for attachment to host cells